MGLGYYMEPPSPPPPPGFRKFCIALDFNAGISILGDGDYYFTILTTKFVFGLSANFFKQWLHKWHLRELTYWR